MIVTDVDELVGGPVSRVIIRDPNATADDFVELAARLGLHGTDYVVGWTAWLDLAPVGVSKASGPGDRGRQARRRPGRRAGHRRRPQRHRDAPVGRPRGGDGPGGRGGPGRGRRTSPRRCTTTAPPSSSPAGSPRREPARSSSPPTSTARWSAATARVSQYTHDVLAELDERGVPVVFVTGRPLRWAEEVFEYVGAHGLAVVSNGALVWDVARDEVDLVREIPVDVGLEVCRLIRDGRARVDVRGRDAGRDRARDRVPGAAPGPRRQPARRRSTRSSTPRRSSCWRGTRSWPPQEFWDRALAAVGRPGGDHLVVDVGAAGDQRGRRDQGLHAGPALRRGWASTPADVVAFGDMPNDLPMLEWAGTSCAMADAHPTVLAAADHVAPATTTTASRRCWLVSSTCDLLRCAACSADS